MNSIQVCCGEFIRIVLFILNFIFWAAGGVILGVGIYVKVQIHKNFADISEASLNTSALILIVLGCIIFVVGLLGCCGSLTQNRCMLLLYFSLVTIIFLGQIAVAIAAYANKKTLEKSAQDQFGNCMDKYASGTDNSTVKVCTDMINNLQINLECCGTNSSSEWKKYSNYTLHPPTSCCKDRKAESCGYSGAYEEGCYTTISDWIETNTKYIGLGVLGVAVVELIGMSLACYLRTYIMKREEYEPYTV